MEPSLRGWENDIVYGSDTSGILAAMEPSLRGWENLGHGVNRG